MRIFLKLIGVVALLMALNGCGGGGGSSDSSSGPVSDSYVFPAGNATLTFSATGTGVPIGNILFSFVLPAGMDVTTTNGLGVSGTIVSTTLGSTLNSGDIVIGSYDSTTRAVTLGITTLSTTFSSGEFMRMTCTVASNTSISLGSLKTNSLVTVNSAFGASGSTSVNLTSSVSITIGAVK